MPLVWPMNISQHKLGEQLFVQTITEKFCFITKPAEQ
jgi:hypothetical protein